MTTKHPRPDPTVDPEHLWYHAVVRLRSPTPAGTYWTSVSGCRVSLDEAIEAGTENLRNVANYFAHQGLTADLAIVVTRHLHEAQASYRSLPAPTVIVEVRL